ncbi:MAG: energy transducer TonB [Pseudomonadota bacterium]
MTKYSAIPRARLPFAALKPLALIALLSIPLATQAQTDDEKRAAMNAAYRQYQELVAQGPQFRDQAIEPAREAYELALEVLGDAHATTAALAMNYGNVVRDGDDAAEILEHALEIAENVHGEEALELVDPLMALGDSATANSEFADARGHYLRAYGLAQTMEPSDPFLEAIIGIQLGTTYFSLNQMEEAREAWQGARANLEPIDNDIARYRLATANFWIGRLEMSQGNHLAAIAPLTAAADVFDRFPEARPFSVNTHTALAEAFERQDQRAEATPHVLFVGAGNTAPTLIYRRDFPNALAEEGPVNLQFDVDAEGFVTNVRVTDDDAEPELAAAATEAVTGLRYAPRFENGAAVATSDVSYEFSFSRMPRR